MTKVGIVGLGIMGGPMASNLLKAGFDVIGFDVVPASLERLAGEGGTKAVSAAQAAAESDVVITMLPNHPQVEAVALGEGGVLDSAKPGTLYIDMSSIRPETARRLAEVGAERGVRVLDAPVSGGEKGAIDGVLSIMVGGAAEDFAAAQPIFDVLGRTIVHVGPAGAGQTVKAANQLVVGGTYALVAEAIVLLEASGIDAGVGLDVLAGGLAGSRILELKRKSMVARQFAPGFRIDLHHKDMGIILDASRDAGVALPVGNLVAALIASARAQGYGQLDHSALLRVAENLSGKGDA
ncbi:2-hydroxy-3-oxopropionate reductase [Actinophytocola algeriensis]|uniref:2-hydroxy-3-oxopropionate reductase n=1 Tax=Actinophytocola algeriensis TaxID=1768010 RepID=A0A7W7Q689_9PSEU|nr:2-hydroxy-3-oxopropionate reductase [Actinophytocola algeriensis]MBB4907835.1 2-hydroxy-3-oxopropionate reductase [Actinophytocola algeriensis]MBE1479865.1 2-hydroxy-3-oxopropionate reductase [Actinophytocola algeriensis]